MLQNSEKAESAIHHGSTPFLMCTKEEFEERLRTHEISVFERTNGNPDPCKVVTKYRRSAAGSVTDKKRLPPRSLQQREHTVNYLASLLIDVRGLEGSAGSLLKLVDFIEDRLRAVQVETVITSTTSKQLQYRAIRCQLLILYLLADCSSSPKDPTYYEESFGYSALHIALSSYWNANDSSNCKLDDEVLAYTLLVHLNEQTLKSQAAGSYFRVSAMSLKLMEIYQKADMKSTQPLLHWTMTLVGEVILGHWQGALSMILPVHLELPPHFVVCMRFCLARSVPFLQWKSLQSYNLTLGKCEKVESRELARLLHIPVGKNGKEATDETIIGLANSYGLPMENTKVSFKAVPIQPIPKTPTGIRLMMDSAVFCETDNCSLCAEGIDIPSARILREILFPENEN